eukprot:g6784.t1
MSQTRVNLAAAKRELAERQDEANLCMVELKHAQEIMAAGGTGPKVLAVTVKEVFGAIAVDRVAVRPDTTPAQEKEGLSFVALIAFRRGWPRGTLDAKAAAAAAAAAAVAEEEAAPASGSAGEEAAAAASAESAAAAAAAEGADTAAVVGEGGGSTQALKDEAGEEGATQTGADTAAAAAASALATTNGDVAAASPATAAALGCSTGTTEVVVPSSELDFTLSQGQWRYLEADSTPMPGDDAVEVTKGIRFSTSLKALDTREDDERILELSNKFDEAQRRVQSAEAMIKKLQPSSAGTSSRKKSAGGGAGARKSALKKSKGGTRAIKSDAGKRKGGGAAGALTAAIGTAVGTTKAVGAFAWGSRNLFFFAAAVAAMHLHGDYLAV